MKKLEFNSNKKIKTFEKNPQNGGTPAIESRAITNSLVKVPVEPKSLNA